MTTDPMPVFVLKAKDLLSIPTIEHYARTCAAYGLHGQAAEVKKAIREFQVWQSANPDALKLPDHEHVPADAEPC